VRIHTSKKFDDLTTSPWPSPEEREVERSGKERGVERRGRAGLRIF